MQKDIFLASEGDAWIERNQTAIRNRDPNHVDPLVKEMGSLGLGKDSKVLEVGCGDGVRLEELRRKTGCAVFGIDPSAKSVVLAKARGIEAVQGTADKLPWDSESFDAVIFGFCLYLCDRGDLFKIAMDADRVLKKTGWLAIIDFFSAEPRQNAYAHKQGLSSYKMDYRKLFAWHPHYETYVHRLLDHEGYGLTDRRDDWVAVSILRKKTLS